MSGPDLPPAVDLSVGRPERLTGRGLVLRAWEHRDLEAMVELFDDPDIALRTPLPTPFTLTDAAERLARATRPDRLVLAVTTDGWQPLGEVLLTATGEVGYMLGAQHRGRGLATRALLVLRDHAHDAMGLERLRLRLEADNAASAAVASRAGFTPVRAAAVVVEQKGRRCVLEEWEHLRRPPPP